MIVGWIFLSFVAVAQQSTDQFVPLAPEREDVYKYVDEDAEFPGGHAAFTHFLSKNLNFPELQEDCAFKSKFTIRFTIEKDGTVSFVQVKSFDGMCFDEMLLQFQDWIAIMPKWTPAMVEGKPVASYIMVPIYINLK